MQEQYEERVACIEYAITQRQLWIDSVQGWLADIEADVIRRREDPSHPVAFDESTRAFVQKQVALWTKQQQDARDFLERRSGVHGTIQGMRHVLEAWTQQLHVLSDSDSGLCLQHNPEIGEYIMKQVEQREAELHKVEQLLLSTSDMVVESLLKLDEA